MPLGFIQDCQGKLICEGFSDYKANLGKTSNTQFSAPRPLRAYGSRIKRH